MTARGTVASSSRVRATLAWPLGQAIAFAGIDYPSKPLGFGNPTYVLHHLAATFTQTLKSTEAVTGLELSCPWGEGLGRKSRASEMPPSPLDGSSEHENAHANASHSFFVVIILMLVIIAVTA